MRECGSNDYSVRLAVARARVAIAHANVLSLELGVSISRADASLANADVHRPSAGPVERQSPNPQCSRGTGCPSATGPSSTNHADHAPSGSNPFCSDCGSRAVPDSQQVQGAPSPSKPFAASRADSGPLHEPGKGSSIAEEEKAQGSILKQQVQGIASRLASLKDQQNSTLKQLLTLRLQQLILRKQQLSALHGLLVAQVQVLGDAPVSATAV